MTIRCGSTPPSTRSTSVATVLSPQSNRMAAEQPQVARLLQFAEFEPQQLRIPPGSGNRQLIVRQDIGALLRLGPARGHHHGDLGDAELPGGEHASMTRNQAAILAH